MTPPKKPDWMEIADGDDHAPTAVVKKRRPLVIAMSALLLTIGGVVIAQSHEDSPASADEMIIPQTSQSATSVAPAIDPASPNNSANPSAPAIATPPNMKGGDDDGDHGFWERDHDGDRGFGDHEGRERGEHDDRDGDFEEH